MSCKRSSFAPGLIALALAPLTSQAAGLIEDSHARLEMRNIYFNQDNRSGSANPSKQEEWGQGFLFDFTSGYTEGAVGVGVDALGMLGIRLDSGKGTHYNPQSTNRGGLVFPTDSDGRAVDEFSTLGVTGKLRVAKTEARLGTLRPKMPVLTLNDGRLLPETFEGLQITSRDLDNFTFTGGQIQRVKSRNSSNNEGMAIAGAGGPFGKRSNAFNFFGVDYAVSRDLTLQYYYGELEDFYRQHFVGLVHQLALPVGSLKTDLRYFDSGPSGRNGSVAGRAEGYRSAGFGNNGKVDNQAFAGLFTYSLGGHGFSLGYQQLEGDSDFPFVNQGDGSATYLITDRQTGARFQKAGERTWVAQHTYNFAAVGIPGLTTLLAYQRGDNIKSAQGDQHEWERDFWVTYAVQGEMFKGLSFSWRNASLRSTYANQRDLDENRLYITYSLPLF
ncbi:MULTISPECIES: OprD family porin [unclassified Pseudomonas]|uniref:OprD family porin n=1 Tax=unclassified Pseudomonas TaxID=196821 RepID=UPI0006D3CAF1|nr:MULTISPECIES: OprD family porin [unclassified Pseudomonas]